MVSSGVPSSEEVKALTSQFRPGGLNYAIIHIVKGKFEVEVASKDKNFDDFADKMMHGKTMRGGEEVPDCRYGIYQFWYATKDLPKRDKIAVFFYASGSPFPRVVYSGSSVGLRSDLGLSAVPYMEFDTPDDFYDFASILKKVDPDAVRLLDD